MCALYIQAYLAGLQSELARLASEIAENTNRHSALHDHLYNRAGPVDDAKMLAQERTIVILSFLAGFAALASVIGNMVTFLLLGFGFFLASYQPQA
jgi:hypothetical protein